MALGLDLGPAPPETGAALVGKWTADIRRLEGLTEAVNAADPDAVIHLAGQSSAGFSFGQPEETFRANAGGTWNLLEAVRRAAPRARVLVVGTGDAYGPHPEGTRMDEGQPFRPVSPYALSKAVADAAAEFYARERGLDVVRTRSFSHVGPGQRDRFFVPSVARQIAESEAGLREPVIRVGNLDVTRDLTDVRDVVEAYVELVERRRTAPYNVCSGAGVRLGKLVGMMIARAAVELRVEVDAARVRPSDLPHLVGDPGAILRDVGWRAERPLAATLDEVMAEWRQRNTKGPGGLTVQKADPRLRALWHASRRSHLQRGPRWPARSSGP